MKIFIKVCYMEIKLRVGSGQQLHFSKAKSINGDVNKFDQPGRIGTI